MNSVYQRRVVITGIGIITAHGAGEDVNWSRTAAGLSSIAPITAFDASRYRIDAGGEAHCLDGLIPAARETRRFDRASHLLIETARQAAEQSGVSAIKSAKRLLVSIGTTLGGMISGERFHRESLEKGLARTRISGFSDYYAHHQTINLLRTFRLRGDFRVYSNACTSGANAIGHAFLAVRSGEADMALCGGYDTMTEFTFAGFSSLMAMTRSCCRPFDRDRDGLVLGEGAGIFVLETERSATERGARILGEVAGYGESSDAYHMTTPDPSGVGAATAIRRALDDAGNPAIDYINAHGTGTQYNDAMEAAAIRQVFGHQEMLPPVSSVKPMIGHLLGGAGAVEAVLSLSAIRNGFLPPNLHYQKPDPACELNIVTEGRAQKIRNVLSNSFGFGGSNAAIVIREGE